MEAQIAHIMSDQVIHAIFNTLLHSLWQGLALLIVAGLTITLTRKSSASLRYELLTSYLLLFAVGMVLTFIFLLNDSDQAKNVADASSVHVVSYETVQAQSILNTPVNSAFSSFYDYINSQSGIIVFIWLLIICIKFARLSIGFRNIYQLKHNQISQIDPYWEDRVAKLSRVLGIKNKVTILESAIAKIPMVLGHLKPIILLPVGLAANLSMDEVEAILLHELSHIRRKDYVVNVFQNCLELLFFFNPAVLWVSAMIKEERENCCDDIVVATTQNKTTYIQALLSCQEYNLEMHQLAMTLSGKKSSLVTRVKRMVYNRNQTLNKVEKGSLIFCLITVVLLTAAFSSEKIYTLHKLSDQFETMLSDFQQTDSLTKQKKKKVNLAQKRFKPSAIKTTVASASQKEIRTNENINIIPTDQFEILENIKSKDERAKQARAIALKEEKSEVRDELHQIGSSLSESRKEFYALRAQVGIARKKYETDWKGYQTEEKKLELDKLQANLTASEAKVEKLRLQETATRAREAAARSEEHIARMEEAKIKSGMLTSGSKDLTGPTGPIGKPGPVGKPGPTGSNWKQVSSVQATQLGESVSQDNVPNVPDVTNNVADMANKPDKSDPRDRPQKPLLALKPSRPLNPLNP